jgi:hypothetical protein
MRDGTVNESADEAQQRGDAFIASEEQKAEDAQAAWLASGHTGIFRKLSRISVMHCTRSVTARPPPIVVVNRGTDNTGIFQARGTMRSANIGFRRQI